MLVSHEKKFIYLKCGKTASTSTEAFLQPYCGDTKSRTYVTQVSKQGIISHPPDPLPGTQFHAHMPARQLRQVLGDEIWDAYFKFANVRNPFDVMVSAYFDQRPYHDDDPSFETWWRRGPRCDSIWSVIEIDDRLVLDDVIRFETLNDDLGRICRRLDIDFDRHAFPRERTTERPSRGGRKLSYQEVIPSASVAMDIAVVFNRTFAEFGYQY